LIYGGDNYSDAGGWRKVSAEEAKAHPLYGLKNWLVVFALGVLLVPLKEFGALKGEAHQLGMTVGQLLDADASFKTYVTLVLATEVAMVASIFGLMASKSAHFRITTSVIWVAFFPLITLFAFLTGTPGSGALVLSFFPWVISCLVWVTYLQRSKRVRVTFEHCVLSKEASSVKPKSQERSFLPAVRESNQSVYPSPSNGVTELSTEHEVLWAAVAKEFDEERRSGLWAQVFSESDGDERKAQARYLKHRFAELSCGQAVTVAELTSKKIKERKVAAVAYAGGISGETPSESLVVHETKHSNFERKILSTDDFANALEAKYSKEVKKFSKSIRENDYEMVAADLKRFPWLACVQDKFGENALHWTIGLNNPKMVRLLYLAGCDPYQKDISGKSPIDYDQSSYFFDHTKS
jgi:hypothetical protein